MSSESLVDSPRATPSSRWLRLSWIAIALVVVAALAVAARPDGDPPTRPERVASLSRELRCPTCRSLSVAESDAPAAQAVRDAITDRVDAGDTDEEVRTYLVSRYGSDILLKPRAGGIAGLVWALPAGAAVVAIGALVFVFRRWRRKPTRRVHVLVGGTLIAVLAAGAGAAVARSSGERLAGDAATGEIELASVDRISRAQALVAENRVVDALKLYDEVLSEDPDNPVALAQRGWLISRAGLVDEGLASIDKAIAADATYPDARFFRAMILWRDKGDPASAADEFDRVLALDPPPDLAQTAKAFAAEARAQARAATTSSTSPP